MSSLVLRGCLTALVTPFSSDGSSIDWDAYDGLVEAQIQGGVSGLVPCGTTGESPTLSDSEQRELVQRTARLAKGRAIVLAGTGTNSTKKTIEASRAAFEAGADAVMIVMPYYNRPSQEGLRQHIELVAKSVSGPVVLYNIPGRTGVDLSVQTLERVLDACPNVIGLKDASNGVHYCQSAAHLLGRLSILSGDDGLTVPMMSVGAKGVISVTSNLYPREVSAVVADMLAGNWIAARDAHLRLLKVHGAMFVEPNPAPVKAALAARGRMTGAVRPPLVALSEQGQKHVLAAIDAYEGR
jgi:4-hydroxy-tetrahydrodipicolinate synthase